jgi:hypothetical protein
VNAQGAIGEGGNGGTVSSASFGLSAVRNAMVEWSLNLGEDILQMVDGRFGGGSAGPEKKAVEHILVLCEHSIFLLKVRCADTMRI